MSGWQQSAWGPVCPVSWPFCHWCELWSILHMTHYRTCYNSWPFFKIHGRCQMSGATCGVVVYRLWDFYEQKRAKVLFRLFNKAYADSLLYFHLGGNAKYSLLVHSQFCIETVTQIESEVISPGSVFGGLMYISVLWPCVAKMSFSMSWQNIFHRELQPRFHGSNQVKTHPDVIHRFWSLKVGITLVLIIYGRDAGLPEESHCYASILSRSD